MNELQLVLEGISALHQIFIVVVFFLGMVLFTYKLGDSPTSLVYVFIAIVAVASPIFFAVLIFG